MDIINVAKLRVQEYAESRLYDRDGVRGAMFVLSMNFGWILPKEKESEDKKLINAAARIVIKGENA
jgi:hypothetical protein